MEQGEPADYVVATYDEIRLRFGLGGTDHARIKAKRRKWVMEPRNNPGSLARIRVPRAEWDAIEVKARSPGTAPEEQGERSPVAAPPDAEQSRKVSPLEGLIAAFREEQGQLRGDLVEAKAERDAARTAAVAATREAAEMRARVAIADVSAKLEAAQAQTRAAVLEAKLEAAEAALAEARRPFWRRWIG